MLLKEFRKTYTLMETFLSSINTRGDFDNVNIEISESSATLRFITTTELEDRIIDRLNSINKHYSYSVGRYYEAGEWIIEIEIEFHDQPFFGRKRRKPCGIQ